MRALVLTVCGGGSSLPRALCEPCDHDSQCEDGVCQDGDGVRKCTLPCAAGPAPECPSGLCNNMRCCMCPTLPMPSDADSDDGGFEDAR